MIWTLSNLALADVCVPNVFQHWPCDSTYPTIEQALFDTLAPVVVHVRWDHDEGAVWHAVSAGRVVTLVGHPGSAGLLPRIGALDVDDAVVSVRNARIRSVGSRNALSLSGNGSVVFENVTAENLSGLGQRAILVRENAVLRAEGLEVHGWEAATQAGAVLRAEDDANVTITGGVFERNHGDLGGAVSAADNASVAFLDSTFTNNLATQGGAIHGEDTSIVHLFRTDFEANTAEGTSSTMGGGAVRNDDDSALNVFGGVFCQNRSENDGGAIMVEAAAHIFGGLFVDNSVSDDGMSVVGRDGATVDVLNSTFKGSEPTSNVRAHDTQTELTVRNSVFVDHTDKAVRMADTVADSLFYAPAVASHYDATLSTNIVHDDPDLHITCEAGSERPHCARVPPVGAGSAGQNMGSALRCVTQDDDLDGLLEHHEQGLGTDPYDADTDGDGVPDDIECWVSEHAELNNPSFEYVLQPTVGGFGQQQARDVPGWNSSDASIVLGDATVTEVTEGVLAARVQGDLWQDFVANPDEPLVLMVHHHNPGPVIVTLEIRFGDVFAPAITTVQLSPNERRVHRLEWTPTTEAFLGTVRFASLDGGTIDQIYLGPDNDTDLDMVPDCVDDDSDGDGVPDAIEVLAGTDRLQPDTDGDGLDDQTDPDPVLADTDQDGLSDTFELAMGLDPNHDDTDRDGWTDGEECDDLDLVNGGFETLQTSHIPGTRASVVAWNGSLRSVRGTAGQNPPSATALRHAVVTDASQDFTTPIGERIHWSVSMRAQNVAASADLRFSGNSTVFSASLSGVSTTWAPFTGHFIADSGTSTLSLDAASVLFDSIAVYPDSSLGPNGLRCADHTVGPLLQDNDHDGVDISLDCNDSDPLVLGPSTHYADQDGDGYGAGVGSSTCPGPLLSQNAHDCDDEDHRVNPAAHEICNGLDDDCNQHVDDGLPGFTQFEDLDGDGFGTLPEVLNCALLPGHALQSGDCDDTDHRVQPGATESCNGLDDDCNHHVDDGLAFFSYFLDADHDGFGHPGHSTTTCDAAQPHGYVADNQDCDDARPHVNPLGVETCDGTDENCNDQVDEGLGGVTYFDDKDDDGFGSGPALGTCEPSIPPGFVGNNLDCNDLDPHIMPGAVELCDEVDNNCHGGIDEGLAVFTFYSDDDADGFGGTPLTTCASSPPEGSSTSSTDCDDTDHTIHPGAPELCDPIDRDCDGDDYVGALDLLTFYQDADGDGAGSPEITVLACLAPHFYVSNDVDCNDSVASIHPGATQYCNFIDSDCDGLVGADDDDTVGLNTYVPDEDGDGYGVEDGGAVQACYSPEGYAELTGDCDDVDNTVFPDAAELCDGFDNDCDHRVDEHVVDRPFYLDADEDGFGDPDVFVIHCAPQPGYVVQGTDCDDENADVNPFAIELCNGVDDNCADGELDAIDGHIVYLDLDGDGFGDPATAYPSCGLDGSVTNAGDCDDTDIAISPNATEVCDLVDNDCNSIVDSDATDVGTFYLDADGDGYASISFLQACHAPDHYIPQSAQSDCDDADPAVHPFADEVCDTIDNDCDGLTDAADPHVVDLSTFYRDADADGFGHEDGLDVVFACGPPGGYVENSEDCDDTESQVNPDATDDCLDDIDNDCDGVVPLPSFEDQDGDGFGTTTLTCQPGAEVDTDCDDTDASIHPEAVEIPGNEFDENCDGRSEFEDDPLAYRAACATGRPWTWVRRR